MDDRDCLLLVEDEPDVRATFRAWLERLNPAPILLEADNAHAALELANQKPIDLVILDWNLGAGINGLELLTSLQVFQPEIVAILVTGYAGMATPLQALRLGVRDYLDKHADLDEETFLGSVRTQLEKIRPRKREARVREELQVFRNAVSQALPWLRHASDLKPTCRNGNTVLAPLCKLLLIAFRADYGALTIWPQDSLEEIQIFQFPSDQWESIPASQFAGTLPSLCQAGNEPLLVKDAPRGVDSGEFKWCPWEEGKPPAAVLNIPINRPGYPVAVLSLYPLQGGGGTAFGEHWEKLASLLPGVLAPLLPTSSSTAPASQWMTALEEALKQAEKLDSTLAGSPRNQPTPTTAGSLVETVRADLEKCWQDLLPPGTGELTTRLLQSVMNLARKHGAPALRHALSWVEETSRLLQEIQTEAAGLPPEGDLP